MATTNSTDFLRFSAYSMKDLITRKLSEDNKFTDQVYEGSNITILIDIVSHMYQCLIYCLNNAAAESMFSDTQIYENINRLCKFIGYNPRGCNTASVEFTITKNNTSTVQIIPRFAKIDTKKTDTNGKKVYYSCAEAQTLTSSGEQTILMYNGEWKSYNEVFTSSGEKYQTFTLSGVKSDAENSQFAIQDMIKVFVYEADSTGTKKLIEYASTTEGLFMNHVFSEGTIPNTYSSKDCIFNLRLNEQKTFEIMFGNGVTGKIPDKDAEIHIVYLQGNGTDGVLSPGEVQDAEFTCSKGMLQGFVSSGSRQDYDDLFCVENTATTEPNVAGITATNVEASSTSTVEESVDDIRRNAPYWFRVGNRLVTTDDYEYFFKNKWFSEIIDVKCQNNWNYITTFYRWLYDLGNNGKLIGKYRQISSNPKNYYINQNKLKKYDLKYSDAADANNIYLWIKMRNDSEIFKTIYDQTISTIKDLTHEPVYLKPLTVFFSPCAADLDDAIEYFNPQEQQEFDPQNLSHIEITISDNTIYTNIDIKSRVKKEILNFFDEEKFTLGQVVNYNDLTNRILQNIPSIDRIRTVYYNPTTGLTRIRSGLSFATWTADFIDVGDDLDISNVSKSLEIFQFPQLYMSQSIDSKITVIRSSISNVNTITY